MKISDIEKLATMFLKKADHGGEAKSLQDLLNSIIEKLNFYEVEPNVDNGRDALRSIDLFRGAVAEKIHNDYLEKYQTDREEKLSPAEKSIRDNAGQVVIKRKSE